MSNTTAAAGKPAPLAPKPRATPPASTGEPATPAFTILDNEPLPPRARVGAASGPSYPFASMKVGQCLRVPVVVAATIKDEAEKVKAFSDEARKVTNRLSGAIRRFKKNNQGFNFELRTLKGVGVGVWRVAASA